METQKLKIKNNNIDSIMFNHYTVPVANQFTSFLNIVPKDNTNRNQASQGEWEVNDDCEVDIISDRKIAIKKFKIDNWIVRKKTGANTSEYRNYVGSFKVKVKGLEYIHNNVIYQEDENGDKIYGFVKAYCGDNGYNVYWYPGQFSYGKYVQGLVIQPSMGYSANSNERDDSFLMGKHPWDFGYNNNIIDGEFKCKWGDGSYGAISIGLFGGYQTATSWKTCNKPNTFWVEGEKVEENTYIQLVEGTKYYIRYEKDDFLEITQLEVIDGVLTSSALLKTPENSEGITRITSSYYYTNTNGDNKYFNYYETTYNGNAYRIYDISDHPIIIDLDVDDTINYAVDLSSKECWDMHLGNTLIYHKPKTLENCWKKYGYASETYVDESGNTQEFGYINVANYTNTSFQGGYILPSIEDLEDNIRNIRWNIKIKNTDYWDTVRNWYENNYTTYKMITTIPLFNNNNFNGKITLKLNEWFDEEHTKPHNYLYSQSLFSNSEIEHVHFVSENGCSFSSGNGIFIASPKLNKITFESPKGWLIGATDMSGILSRCGSLTEYPYNLIKWDENRTNTKGNGIKCTLMGWFSEYTPLIEVPSYNTEDRYADDNTMMFATYAPQVFNGCGSLKKIGPVMDLCIVEPTANNTPSIFNCPNLEDCRIKNLNHGNWSFDNKTRDEGYIGYLPKLNQESINYLFDNLADLTTSNIAQHVHSIYKSFKDWGCEYWYTADTDAPVKAAFRFMDTNLRIAEDATSYPYICYTNQTFEAMEIAVYNLQEGDRIEFGSGKIEKTDNSITENGYHTISKTNTNIEGFQLYSTNANAKEYVSIQIVNGYDPTNPLVKTANLYLPAEWDGHVMSAYQGWNFPTVSEKDQNPIATLVDIYSRKISRRYKTTESGTLPIYTTNTITNLRFKVSGLTSGDTLAVGTKTVLSEQTLTYTTDGTYTIESFNPNGDEFGFVLYNDDTSITNEVTITIIGSDNYTSKVSDAMVKAANNKGWAVYVGGTLKLVK